MTTLTLSFAFAKGGAMGAWSVANPMATVGLLAAAALADSVLMAEFFKPPPVKGPKLGSLEFTTSDEGEPVQVAYGRNVRVPCHLLDVSELLESEDDQQQGGKGGAAGAFLVYKYASHVMLSLGEGPVQRLKKLRANGKIIYNEEPDVDLTSTAITGTVSYTNGSYSPGVNLIGATWDNTTKKVTFAGNYTTFAASGFVAFSDVGTTGLTEGVAYPVVARGTSFGSVWLQLDDSSNPGLGNGAVDGSWYRYSSSGGYFPGTHYLRLVADVGDVDLSAVMVGGNKLQIIDPSSQAGYYKVVDSGSNADGTTFCVLSKVGSAFAPITHGTTVTLFQENPQWLAKIMGAAPQLHVSPTTGKLGAHDQPVDTLFESLRGNGLVPAYRGLVTVTLTNLNLFDFGNTLPQFEADVVVDENATVGEFIEAVAIESGIDPSQVDASAITTPLLGLVSRGPQASRERITTVMLGYEITSYEEDGVLVFDYRKDAPHIAIDSTLLGAFTEGRRAARPAMISDADDDPPESYIVSYRDEARDWQIATQQGIRQSEPLLRVQPVDLSSLSMEPADAKALAEHLAWSAPNARRSVQLNLPPSEVWRVREGVVLDVTLHGRARELLVVAVDMGADGMLEADCVLQTSGIYDYEPEPDAGFAAISSQLGSNTQHSRGMPTPLVWSVFNAPPLANEHAQTPGMYVVAAAAGGGSPFTGAALYQALDEDGEDWARVLTIEDEATMGLCSTAIPPGSVGVWDDETEIDVVLYSTSSASLSSVSKLACLNGRNRALVGGELIGFRNAELIDENTYRLSGLLRGLRGTEAFADSGQEIGAMFVLLTGGGVHWLPMQSSSIGSSRRFRMLANGERLLQADEQTVECDGSTCRPFAPTHVHGLRDASNNLTISWARVSRSSVRLLSPQAIPLDDPFEQYEVDVVDPTDDNAVLRTISCATSAVTYTAAQQTADGLTPGDDVTVILRQIGNVVYRGAERLATL